MHVKGGEEVHPEDLASIIFLHQQNISKEVVPVEEPPMSKHVQNVKDRGAILFCLMRPRSLHLVLPVFQGDHRERLFRDGGRRGRSWSRGRRGCRFQPLGWWSGRGGQRHL